ncbi:hypothetical protein [Streptomyces sp. NPDC059828]|uniref:hypothetical protein n=1 Tax=Streptomyces sp. NPDC059828 TaxID=3346965 RepID=UPI003651507E
MRSGAPAGVFVAALLVLLYSAAKGWGLLVLLSTAVLIGVLVAAAAQRQMSADPDARRFPADRDRPWRRGSDDVEQPEQ